MTATPRDGLGTSSPEKFAEMIRTETEKWAKVVKFSGAQLD